jgi:hypothetical protein
MQSRSCRQVTRRSATRDAFHGTAGGLKPHGYLRTIATRWIGAGQYLRRLGRRYLALGRNFCSEKNSVSHPWPLPTANFAAIQGELLILRALNCGKTRLLQTPGILGSGLCARRARPGAGCSPSPRHCARSRDRGWVASAATRHSWHVETALAAANCCVCDAGARHPASPAFGHRR